MSLSRGFIGKSNIFLCHLRATQRLFVFSLPSGNELRVPTIAICGYGGEIYRLLLRPEAIEFEQSP